MFVAGSFLTVDKVGRRPLLLGGGIGCIICLLIVGGAGRVAIDNKIAAVIITFCCVWCAIYSMTLGP